MTAYTCGHAEHRHATREHAEACLDYDSPDPGTRRSVHGSVPAEARYCGDCHRQMPQGRDWCPCWVRPVEVSP